MYTRVEVLLGIISLTVGLLALIYLFPERWWTDRRFNMPRHWAFSHEVMLVGLDERYAERHGSGPTSSAYLAAVVRASLRYRPTAIALDFRLSEAEQGAAGMDSLAAAVREANARGVPVIVPAVLATWQGNTEVVRTPPRELAGRVVGGYVGWDMEGDGPGGRPAPRDFPAARRLSQTCYALSFPLAAVAAHRGELASPAGECLGLGTVPDTAVARILPRAGVRPRLMHATPIYFAGPVRRTRDLLFYSSERLLQDAAQGAISETYRGKLVLVAALYPSAQGQDLVVTPFGSDRGGLIHLYAMDTLLRDGLLRRGGPLLTLILSLAVFLAVGRAWRRWGLRAWMVTVATLVFYIITAFVVFGLSTFLLPVAWPVWSGVLATALGFIVYGQPAPPEPPPAPPHPREGEPAAIPTVDVAARPAARRVRAPRPISGIVILTAFWSLLLVLVRGRRP
jgi:CHASE2 domain-containing sensor protein